MGHYYYLDDRKLAGDGYRLAKQVLRMSPRPTAIFAACDLLAAGVLQAIYEEGLRVPDQISIVGFDDTFAPYLTPKLTTVEQPMAELGRIAARLALRALDLPGDEGEYAHERLSTRLVVRDSTGPASV